MLMNPACWFRVGAVLGLLGVMLGAFGAHGLRERMQLDERALTIFETGVRYQMYHAFALIAVGLAGAQGAAGRAVSVAGWAFLIGTILFSGSLYLLALEVGPKKLLGPITPIGGLAFLVGWIALALSSLPSRASS